VEVDVAVAVELAVGDGVNVEVGDLVAEAVADAVGVMVSVGLGVTVCVGGEVELAVAEDVAVAEGVWLGSLVADCVAVGVGVWVGSLVGDGTLEGVSVDVDVWVTVAVGTGVEVLTRAVPVTTTMTGDAVVDTVGNLNGDSRFAVGSGLAVVEDAIGDASGLAAGEDWGLTIVVVSTVPSTGAGLACAGNGVGEAGLADGLDSTDVDAGCPGIALASDIGVPTISGELWAAGDICAIAEASGVGVP
jgi:hypothetical protein